MRNEYMRPGLVIAASIAGVLMGVVYSYTNSFKEVQVNIPPGSSVSIYKNTPEEDDPYGYNENGSPHKQVSSSQKLKLKKTTYIAVVTGPVNEYKDPKVRFEVRDDSRSVDIHPNYTEAKLAALLTNERVDAQKQLISRYPKIRSQYTIVSERLYQLGDWYGAILKPLNPDADSLKVIMKKTDGKWISVVKYPSISIGQPSHPDVPLEVLEAVDRLTN